MEGAWIFSIENLLRESKTKGHEYNIFWANQVESQDEAEFRLLIEKSGDFAKALYNYPGDKLGDFLAGTITYSEYKQHVSQQKSEAETELSGIKTFAEKNRGSITRIRDATYVSCWSKSTDQNLALWKIYGKGDDCVAITTSEEKLDTIISANKAALDELGFKAVVREVLYFPNITHPNYSTLYLLHRTMHITEDDETIFSLRIKPMPYEYEKEVRLIVFPSLEGMASPNEIELEIPIHENVFDSLITGIEISNFIEEVHLPPQLTVNSPQYKAIQAINQKFGVQAPIKIDNIKL